MLSETTKPTQSLASDRETHKPFDREVRDMVHAITSRVGYFQKQPHEHQVDEDEHGIRVITLAGTNTGATMRSELDEKGNAPSASGEQPEAMGTYVNSNFQAVNNSIMMGSSYSTNDPGVHLDISDFFEHHPAGLKHAKKGKKKVDKEALKSDHQTEHSN